MVDLKVYVVTFNCGRVLIDPDTFGRHLFDNWEDPSAGSQLPDVVVLTLQEIAPLGYAFLGGNLVKPYLDRFRQAVRIGTQKSEFADDQAYKYFNVLARNSGLTAIMVFAREDLVDDIHILNVAEVGVGVAEMGNKGAIGARIGWKLSSDDGLLYTTFVSAHLAPFEAEIDRRDQDYVNIVRSLVFAKEDAREWRKGEQGDENVPLLAGDSTALDDKAADEGIYARKSHLIFAGDLNYRTALTTPARDDAQHFPQPTKDTKDALHYSQLLEKDQLTQQLHNGKTLHGLTEQQINFPPTYKYDRNEDKPVLIDKDLEQWNWAKHRWPSWCDRILYSPTQVQAGKYNALPLFSTSDHRPVSLSIAIPLKQVTNSQLVHSAPAPINPRYKSEREAARRKEFVVGLAAYLGWTWEGNSLVLGTLLIVLGGIWITKSMS